MRKIILGFPENAKAILSFSRITLKRFCVNSNEAAVTFAFSLPYALKFKATTKGP
jgi:hypothetical protein